MLLLFINYTLMTQNMTQKKPTLWHGNTINVPKRSPSRARNWCFTLNNYTKKDIDTFFDLNRFQNLKQYCFQEEMGEEKTPHLQGVLAYKNAIEFTTVKKIHPLAHWEKCKSLKASLQYCSKEDSRVGKTYTWNYEIFNEGKPLTKTNINDHFLNQALADLKSVPITLENL